MMKGPIEVLRGSKAPGDVLEKTMHQLGFRLDENHQWVIPFWWLDPHTFLNSRLPSKLAVPPRRIVALPGQTPHGRIICSLNAYGLPELHLEIIGEEQEQINLCESLNDWAYVDTSLAAHAGSTVSAVASGAVSLLMDTLPVWAEATAVLAIASTIPRKRVRLLLNFSTDRQPMVVETAEVVAVLLDLICGGSDEDEECTGDAEGEIHVMF